VVSVGVIAVDGAKVPANAGDRADRSVEEIAQERLAEADAVDRDEDERFGRAAVTSCRSSWPMPVSGARGCATRAGSLGPSALPSGSRSRSTARRGCGRPAASSTPNRPPARSRFGAIDGRGWRRQSSD